MNTLIDHFERTLGPVVVGWGKDPEGEGMPCQVVRFGRGSGPGTISFATLGLSRYPLSSPTSGRAIRHELLIIASETMDARSVPGLLAQVASAALESRQALVRGQVIGPAGPLQPGLEMEALYVTGPAYFPDEFATFEDADGTIVLVWLVPISATEADYVSSFGWESFEDLLVQRDPDLTDWTRKAMIE